MKLQEKRRPGRPRKRLRLAECGDALTLYQAADVLGVSYKLVYYLVDRQEIRAIKLGRLWRIPRVEMERLLLLQGEQAVNE